MGCDIVCVDPAEVVAGVVDDIVVNFNLVVAGADVIVLIAGVAVDIVAAAYVVVPANVVGIVAADVVVNFNLVVLLFQIEAPEELKIRFQVSDFRNETVKRLWRITERLNTLHPQNW